MIQLLDQSVALIRLSRLPLIIAAPKTTISISWDVLSVIWEATCCPQVCLLHHLQEKGQLPFLGEGLALAAHLQNGTQPGATPPGVGVGTENSELAPLRGYPQTELCPRPRILRYKQS